MAESKVLVVGALGRMGERVRAAVGDHAELRVGALLEVPGHPSLGQELDGVALTDDVDTALAASDVVIDFSVPASTLSLLAAAAKAGVPFVTGTTGLDEDAKAEVARIAEQIPVLQAANFSLSVNVLAHLSREAARLLGPDFEAELFELHHSAKRDAPSGTALRLAEAVAEGRGLSLSEHLVLERAGEIGPRPDAAIGIQTLRGGDNPGEHTVMFVGQGERVELSHRSHTRDHFARGAARAAAWIVGRAPGRYTIDQVLGLD